MVVLFILLYSSFISQIISKPSLLYMCNTLLKLPVHLFVFSGGGPVLGRRSRGVGQSRAAAAPDEAPGGMSQDLSGTVFRCKCYTQRRLQLQ